MNILTASKKRTALLTVLIVAPWLLVGWVVARQRPAAPANAEVTAGARAKPPVVSAAPGPWGNLELTPITIEAPAELNGRVERVDTSVWYFGNTDVARLGERLKSTGLSEAQREALLQGCTREEPNGLKVKPDSALVLGLSPEVRAAVYEILREDRRNAASDPFRRRFDPNKDWIADSGMTPEGLALTRKLIYRRRNLEILADVSVLFPMLEPADREKLFRAISRQPAELVRLRVDEGMDVGPLIDYWGKGGREREVGPLLKSLAKIPGGSKINVTQLLSQFARGRAYTYPRMVGTSMNGQFDCHWTTFNFWTEGVTDDGFASPEYVIQQLRANYRLLDKPSQVGDVIFFVNPLGQGVHSAIYVADDIVFTKNGNDLAAPFVLMKLPDLLEYYELSDVARTMIFRRKDL